MVLTIIDCWVIPVKDIGLAAAATEGFAQTTKRKTRTCRYEDANARCGDVTLTQSSHYCSVSRCDRYRSSAIAFRPRSSVIRSGSIRTRDGVCSRAVLVGFHSDFKFSMAIMVSQPPWRIHTEHLAPDVFQRAPLNLQHDAGTWATHEARSASSALAVGGRLIHEGDR